MNSASVLKTLQAQIGGMDCGGCAKTIEATLQQLPGVTEAKVSFATERLSVTYDSQQVNETAIRDRVTALGYTIEPIPNQTTQVQVPSTQTLQAQVSGMDCGGCARTIAANLQQLSGVTEATVNFASERLNVIYDPQQVSEIDITKRVTDLGYTVEIDRTANSSADADGTIVNSADCLPSRNSDLGGWQFWLKTRRGQTVVLSGIGLLLGWIAERLLSLPLVAQGFYAISLMIAIVPILRAAWIALKLRRADMNLLMTLAAIGAAILNQWLQGALVIFLFALGTTLQNFTLGRTRNAIRDLMDLTPATATVRRSGQEVSVPVARIQIGEILTIRPGQRIALDGVVISGLSAVDQSPITGESLPENKEKGDQVFAGTLNQTRFLEVEVTHTASDTTVARIVHLVEEAQESRAPIQQWVDRFSAIYTPIVLALAAGITLIPPLLFAQPFQPWFYKALVLLVIACPCALVIATPVSLISAIGAATRQGVLFKSGNALETAGRLTTLAFDKTGTITQGLPVVQKVQHLGSMSANMVLLIAASLEQQSEHPLAKAIVVAAMAQGLDLEAPESFTAVPGKGIWAKFGQAVYFVGNRRLFEEQNIELSAAAKSLLAEIESQGQTPVLIGTQQGLVGAIALADGIRLESAEAVRLLKRIGLKRLVMLTGDRSAVARQVAHEVGIEEYQAELLPEDKLQAIYKLRRSGVVGMVGDGINDTPALSAADVSFAVGKIDVALEAADVVLVGNDLRRLGDAINLSRRTLLVIQQSIAIALVLNATFIILGVLGVIGLPIAVFEDMGSSLLVTLNAMRLFKIKINEA
ncbi:cation-transporting ATPase (plasmid) [Leptolyngbya boryana NIES-2135]|jgi:Cd2+/Zn2+-exporting ATPase|uniref:Cation-transporting ATPase n=1 Tax=Leptolyngbya boryana NIES-2135 TaxID=1973484 RepID=A0A1Z4JRI6_LEPBY|nr:MULTISPECIES: heavy metal translocating P-type ATPase [Leptolyngbya]BAY59375.1 cation-transporting ATPase [Leptolyngbya boryana NIES-2135]MBD2372963.1 cadmium-translocating P-type ATPase [Leptolyngbya sp. FACHB-238]MBD2397284.1 cadmium-translocating P-type ATPase [Leptolyngbya sp. FACHB-239]MBD2403910.1 cadmium-translocating P-type ATPase [Leptolyngbya sp. FACHB-402]ULP33207.1 cadmium-translocating P-type ATPase [Leptolyngbya boryana IU 594]